MILIGIFGWVLSSLLCWCYVKIWDWIIKKLSNLLEKSNGTETKND